MPPHKLTLAVTGMDTGTHLFFHVERDEILRMAQTWANGIKSLSKQDPDKNPDPAYQAFATLWDMLLNHEGPVTPVQEAAAVYLFSTSSGWEAVEGPSKITIEEDGFEVAQVAHDLEKLMRDWEAKFEAVDM